MSTTDNSNLDKTSSLTFTHTPASYNYAVTHVFFPVKLPQENDYTLQTDLSLARAVCAAALTYSPHVEGTTQWHHITKMLNNLQASALSEQPDRDHIISQLCQMQTGDILVFFIRPENAAVFLTKQEDCMLFEPFETSPNCSDVEGSAEALICSYPWSAVKISNEVFDAGHFQSELADFLSPPHAVDSGFPSPHASPQHIIALLTGISRGFCHTVGVLHITKRVRDDVVQRRKHGEPAEIVWRRSPFWLLVRVAIQMAVDRSPLGRASYKQFILFFVCTLARDPKNTDLSSDLLHLMSAKIFRRLKKLGSSVPDWLSTLALNTCTRLRDILDTRWKPLSTRSSLFRNPSQDELRRDTQFSLPNSHEYICNVLTSCNRETLHTPFHPSHRRRGTIEDFLSSNGSFFEEAYNADPHVTLYDVEKSVEQGIDDWIACVTNVEEACVQLEILMEKYMTKAYDGGSRSPEGHSIMLLTAIELFVALDKLVVREIPMLADYSPGLPITLLEGLFLRKATNLHRLGRAYQYLFARHSRSHPGWSVLSDEFTEDSFAVRYYDQSPHLQRLKTRIENAIVAEHDGLQLAPVSSVVHPRDGHQEDRQDVARGRLAGSAEVSRSPLPTLPLYAKVVVFELDCPASVRTWRSAAPRIWYYFYTSCLHRAWKEDEGHLLAHAPALQHYFVDREGPPLHVQIHFAYFYPGEDLCSRSNPRLHYVLRHPRQHYGPLSVWQPDLPESDSEGPLDSYVAYTSHTSNDVLATQACCPPDISLDEFIALGHLRSGALLQWLNILHGLRSRSLSLHRYYVYFFIYFACQVGPLDSNTGAWIWHEELQDPAFCNALLDELDTLFMDVGAGMIDVVMMSTTSLLLTRVLASSPSECFSERAITLLRNMRKKTFGWVQELSYNLLMAPMNEERSNLLCNMAATCRSTFDVDPATLCKVLYSAEDVDVLISCALLTRVLGPGSTNNYLQWLLKQDCRLSLVVEETLSKVILADALDYGVDLAVGKIFASHKPSALRWEQSQHPNARWLTCKAEATRDQPSQTVYHNLLDGELRMNGQPLGGLLHEIMSFLECKEIFDDQGFFLVPSNLPGMDFVTLATMSERKVHFSLRDDNLVIRVQSNQTNDILELIPPSKLRKDLPLLLVDRHVHWFNLSTKVIEIRPLERLWEESSENWRIDCTSGQYRVYKGRETLVDVRSLTWAMLVKCFKCLDGADNLLVTVSSIDPHKCAPVLQLSIALTGCGLSFFVNEREKLESRDFKDMVYDENQCVQALFGLEHLVLRHESQLLEELVPRRVLVKSGFPNKHGDYQVSVATQAQPNNPSHYHTYVVDTELGCLIGNGSLTSTWYLAYLHAMTSSHIPDPLTGKTGAQAALALLQSAGCRSIMKLKAVDNDDYWTSTQYPQINIAQWEIQHRYYWNRSVHGHKALDMSMKRASRRAMHLFPWHAIGPTPLEYSNSDDGDGDCLTAQSGTPTPSYPISPPPYTFDHHAPWQITLNQLLSDRPAPELPPCSTLTRNSYKANKVLAPLDNLFSSLPTCRRDSFQQKYLAQLDASAQRVRQESRITYRVAGDNSIEVLKNHYVQCRVKYLDALDALKKSLGPTTDPHEQAVERFGEWPPITADVLLRCLASTSPINVPVHWKKCLVSLALLLSELQRARRLLRFALDGLEEEFSKELENEGYDGWNPEDHPDWLLIQIQGNFLVRRGQVATAIEMISPRSGRNTVLQVNMGEGKSSVIVPITAAALADGKQLVRIIVPKALTAQMFELLVSRLAGLANRPIYHLPFSRAPEYDGHTVISLQIDDLYKLMHQCMAERGILLVQPEHIVSLRLMSVEQQLREETLVTDPLLKPQQSIYKYIMTALSLESKHSLVENIFRSLSQLPNYSAETGDAYHDDDFGWDNDKSSWGDEGASDAASKWLNLQKWMHSHVRDILDESDEILHPRFQLIYTIGLQQHMDGYPDRWTITQQVLWLVKKHAESLSRDHPNSIQYECGPSGSFPHVRIVRASQDGGQCLISSIAEDVMSGGLRSFDFQHISPGLYEAIRSFITEENVLPDTARRVEEYAKNSQQSHLRSGLLLLRGLLACNILLFSLAERRWRVDYGLVSPGSSHTMLAVPYQAKDVPAPNTQFGHPDITIILTCLSYYYSGLTEDQLRVSFEVLLDQDDSSMEYALWVREYGSKLLPESLQKLSEINVKSSEQWDKIILPLFTRNRAAIDFYLSRVVFPKEAKEFPLKLSASSWDLAEERRNAITGFSGTNDSRWLLPMSISQRDLDHQQGANARVLGYLLQPENDTYMVTHENGKRWTTLRFLQTVAMQRPKIRVLLDVGAQILDLSNFQVAKAWLDIVGDTSGAIYFDENDELMVVTKNGNTQSMLSSPLSQRLDHCVVYLDHAHTRGTDIKLPVVSRAAVTIGPKVTKDSLVQGCMRMRKLGYGHSVMFFAPLEVDRSIRGIVCKKDPKTRVGTADVLCWAIHETWTDIQQRAPYWAQQGMNYRSRSDAWARFCNDEIGIDQLSDTWIQPEFKSLANLYAPCETKSTPSILSELDPAVRQRCKDLGVLSLPSAQMEEEQEREVNRQREREREVELPPRAEPVEHNLHQDVVAFVNTGVIPPLDSRSAFHPVFTTLKKSSAATCEADVWSPFVLATADFCRTIEPKSTRGGMDQYLRPVQWVLSRKIMQDRERLLVLLSPFEAYSLLPAIRASKYVHLHVYAPRTSQRMKPSDDLKLYTIPALPCDWTPPWDLIDQLNVFAGQLYVRDYQSYLRLCRFLDVPTKESPNDTVPRWNLFNIPGGFEENKIMFSHSPLPSVWGLLAIRTRGRPFTQTHMGKILQGQVLAEKDFEQPSSIVSPHNLPGPVAVSMC